MNVIVLTNPKAGATEDPGESLRQVLADAGVGAQVREVRGAELVDAARQAASEKFDAVVAAGGDGTINAVAGALAHEPMPMGILPTGTLNHFARDLGLPMELSQAAQVIAAAHLRQVDVAEVNGHIFANNSSIGLYPHIVGHRDRQRERLGRGKWLALFFAAISVFKRYPTVRVRIGVGDRSILRTTPFVFVGNNKYDMRMTQLGTRPRLDGGELSVYFTNRTGRLGLLWLALRAILGKLRQSKDFESLSATQVWIESSKRELRVAVDGEVVRMKPPLEYRIHPLALRVLAPDPSNDTTGERA